MSTPLWAEDFTTLDLITPNHTGRWSASANAVGSLVGAKDPAGHSWNANPNQSFPKAGVLNPFRVAPVADSKGSTSNGNALTIFCHKCNAAQLADTSYPRWGGTIVGNGDIKTFSVGCYVEVRALFSGTGTGVWPSIWFFAAAGQNGALNAPSFQGAEIDLVEPQGNLSPGWISLHMRQSGDAPNLNYQVNGSSDINGSSFYGYPIVENIWATYGMDWQKNAITFYLNGVEVAKQTNPVVLSYFNQAKMAFRADYTMESGTDGATDPVSLSIDYIYEWATFAASISPPAPTPPFIPVVTATVTGTVVSVNSTGPFSIVVNEPDGQIEVVDGGIA
jgi:hypothetical protein